MEINTSSIKKDAEKINEFLQNLDNDYKNIKTSIESLKSGWQGERANKFYKGIEETYLVELKATIDALNNYYVFLSSTPEVYQTLDNSYSNKKIDV